MEPPSSPYAKYFEVFVEELRKYLLTIRRQEVELALLAPALKRHPLLNDARNAVGSFLPLLNAAADARVINLRRAPPQNYVSLPAAGSGALIF